MSESKIRKMMRFMSLRARELTEFQEELVKRGFVLAHSKNMIVMRIPGGFFEFEFRAQDVATGICVYTVTVPLVGDIGLQKEMDEIVKEDFADSPEGKGVFIREDRLYFEHEFWFSYEDDMEDSIAKLEALVGSAFSNG